MEVSMNRRWTYAIPLLALLLAGCGSKDQVVAPDSGESMAQSTAADEVGRHPELIEDSVYETQTQAQASAAEGVSATIDPLFFWREILRVQRTVTFAFSDTDSTGQPTRAVVTVHKRLSGSFNVLARDPGTEDTTVHVIRKPLHDHWVRRVLLRRVTRLERENRPWRIAAVSGVEVTSRDGDTRLVSLRIQSGTLDTTITDPLAFWRLQRVIRLDPDASVTLTATTQASDDVVVFYARDRRVRFHDQGDGTHTLTWTTGSLAGLRHVGVNALSHGTLFDDEAPYDSQTWIVPYVVAPTELAELAP
jgi:hypothetical protein